MKLKKAMITSFGKFSNQTFDFEEGLNVIYGLNEAGKSTLHSFIEAIFYGFIDPTKSRKTYLPEHAIYEPKTNDAYGGSLIFELNKQTYRLTRNLQKNARKDLVSLVIESTGNDITNTLDIDPVSKMPDIAKFIDLPYLMYKNTLSIRQLESETQSALGDNLVTRLQNLQTTKTETLSSQKALNQLEKALSDIGTERAKTKPLGETYETLETLNQEKAQALSIYEKTMALSAELEDKLKSLNDLEKEKIKWEKETKKAKNDSLRNNYEKLLKLHDELKALDVKLHGLKPYEKNPKVDYTNYVIYRKELKELTDQIQTLNNDIKTLETDLTHIDKTAIKEAISLSKLKADLDALDELEKILEKSNQNHKKHLDPIKVKFNYEKLKRKVEKIEQAKSTHVLIKIIFFLYFIPRSLLRKRTLKRFNKVKKHYDYVLTKEKIETILNTYQLNSKNQLYELYRNVDKFQNLKETISKHHMAITNKQTKLNEVNSSIKILEETYNVDSIESFNDYLNKFESYQKTYQEIQVKRNHYESLLEGKTIEDYKLAIDETLEKSSVSLDTATSNLETIQRKIYLVSNEMNQAKTTISHLNQSVRDIETIDTEINLTEEKLETLLKRKETIENAVLRIKAAVSKIEEHFAPLLSEGISKYLKIFTGDIYEEIKIRKDLSFSVYSNKTNQLETKDYFSLGTKDQIYFAIRLGILDTLKVDTLPLFLDDAFLAYDDERLNHALKTLNQMQKDRQMVLFTCQKREHTALKTLKIPFNKISL